MRKSKRQDKPEEDLFIRFTALQIIMALVTGGVFFAAFKTESDLFSRLRADFISLMAQDMDISDFIPYNFMKTETTSAPESTQETEKPQTSAEQEQANEKAETTRSESETTTAAAPENGEDISAAGTETLPGLPCAVMPVEGTFTSSYGNRIHPVYGTECFHSGTDIAAAEGTPILAAYDGTVTECSEGERSGVYVKLDNGNGVETVYCHCKSLNVQNGQRVKRGDVIAFVGQTGVTTGPHLHFELHVNGQKLDPAIVLDNAVSVS